MKRTWILVAVISITLAFGAFAAEKKVLAPSEKDKCAVCGMFVAKYPNWACAIVFRGDSPAWFDGPKDMFTYYLDIGKYNPGKNRSNVVAILVKDYYTMDLIDAEKAYYVIGSDVTGPMGAELVPFFKPEDAAAFLKEHKGKKVLRAYEVTPALLKELR
jgi:nitrous oxide reductase accessory protein NosL